MIKLDFSTHPAAQDMIRIVMAKKGLSAKEAIDFAVNREMADRILQTGWGSIALGLWGHGGPMREWDVLDDPMIEMEFDELREGLINEVIAKEKVDTGTWVYTETDDDEDTDDDMEMDFDAEADFDMEMNVNMEADVDERENIDAETAVSYFLIFTMESFGYHI